MAVEVEHEVFVRAYFPREVVDVVVARAAATLDTEAQAMNGLPRSFSFLTMRNSGG